MPGNPNKCFIPLLIPEVNSMFLTTLQEERLSISDQMIDGPVNRLSNSKTNLRLQLLDKDMAIVKEDYRELTVLPPEQSHNFRSNRRLNHRLPLLRAGILQKKSENINAGYEVLSKNLISDGGDRFNGLVAPFFFTPEVRGDYEILLFCSTKRMVEFRIKVTEEELQRFDAAKVEISYSE